MKALIIKRFALIAQVGLVAAQIVAIAFALQAKANEATPEMIAREVIEYRIEIQKRAGGAAKMAQDEAQNDLAAKLERQKSDSSARIAGETAGNSG